MKAVGLFIAAGLAFVAGLLLVALVRTLVQKKKAALWRPETDPKKEQMLAEKLSRMVQVETVSERGISHPEKFARMHEVMEDLFPNVFQVLEVHNLDGSLLLKWQGRSAGKPIALMSHLDVVAAGQGWSKDPFGGEICDGKVWGRGTADTKGSVMAFYQAVEELIQEGYRPAVDVYLISSCTEEVAGGGAPMIVEWLKDNGVHLAMVCDEGGAIIEEPIAGIPGCFAMVGLFEKGQGDVKFTARSAGGHSSMPSKNTPLPRLGAFMADVEKHDPMDVQLTGEVKAMFERLAPYASFPLRYVLGNLWLFGPVLKRVLPSMSPQAAAMLKTTIAFTKAQGSDGFNVIPDAAWVTANMRYIPHQKQAESTAAIRAVADKYGLETEVLQWGDPSDVLALDGPAFTMTETCIKRTFPGLEAVPYVVTGGTDCRFYTSEVTDACVRFAPLLYGSAQMKGMHGIDECIETVCLEGAVNYYKNLIKLQEERV